MTDILSRKGERDAFAVPSGADTVVGGGVDDAPRRDAADGESAPGGSWGYVLEGEAGLDWLYGGAGNETTATRLIALPDAVAEDDADPVLVRSRRVRRRQRRRF